MAAGNSVETVSLAKSFGDVRAVDGISMEVGESEIFGFLGPNGAGKSTTMMILTTLLKPTSGKAFVAGYDVASDPGRVRQSIGYVQQETTVDEYLTGRENLLLQARLNHIPGDQIGRRIDDILDLIELADKQDDAVITYSGGMRKRLDIAGGLLHRPRVLFLDEPMVGLDIQTRRKIWQYVRSIHKEFGMTIFVSTHYMEEADRLCDRVAIVDHGRIQAIDTPQSMKDSLGQEVIQITASFGDRVGGSADGVGGGGGGAADGAAGAGPPPLVVGIRAIPDVRSVSVQDGGKITVYAANGTEVIPQIFMISSDVGAKIESILLTRPTLDDVFISYTGHELRDGEEGRFNRRREHAKMRGLRQL